jgi:pre-mRNA cleavage complex 2 protein Pcf11
MEHSSESELYTDYINALNDLTFNSKPMINTLTIIADENKTQKEVIVRAIKDEMIKVSS